MAAHKVPCPTVLRLLLRYEPETGRLFWRPRTARVMRDARGWNSQFAGKEAFRTVHSQGYRMGVVFQAKALTHRVVWAMVHGAWPNTEIDHIDGDRLNNRIANLRPATRSENVRNAGSRGGTSRFCGVSWDASRQRWIVSCKDQTGGHHHLGRFTDEILAAKAYDAAAREWHGEFARLNFP